VTGAHALQPGAEAGDMVTWRDLVCTFRHHVERARVEETERLYLIRRKVDAIGSGVVARETAALGEQRLQRFEEILEHGYAMKRHYFERQFHGKCVMALAETLMGDDWAANGVKVFQERGWLEQSKFVCAMAPRRFGKSVSTAKIIAAVAEVLVLMPEGLNFSTYSIAIFSTGKRASQGLSAYVEGFIKERHLTPYVIKNNSEEIVLRRKEGRPMTVAMKFLPSNPDRLVFALSPSPRNRGFYRAGNIELAQKQKRRISWE
jgi:hypothetical protein